MEFEGIYVKLGSANAEGTVPCQVMISLDMGSGGLPEDVEVSLEVPQALDVSLRELRERAKDGALEMLQEAVRLLEQFSVDELTAMSEAHAAQREKDQADNLQAELRGMTLDGGTF